MITTEPRIVKMFKCCFIIAAMLLTTTTYAAQNGGTDRSKPVSDDDSIPSVESLLPYQSAIASFQRKIPEDETLAFVISITSSAESYATMIKRELESQPDYEITVTVTPLRNSATGETETWRIFGVSKQVRLGDLSEAKHHELAGWAYSVAGYFNSTLNSFNYRL